MKLTKYAKYKDNPAVKGLLSVEELVKADWERNYKKQGVPLNTVRLAIKQFVDDGWRILRQRNTLIILSPDEDNEDVLFHTVTADPYEVYITYMQLFLLALAQETGAETAFTYVDDKTMFRAAKKALGDKYAELEESDNPDQGKYKIVLDVGSYYNDMKRLQMQQSAGGK